MFKRVNLSPGGGACPQWDLHSCPSAGIGVPPLVERSGWYGHCLRAFGGGDADTSLALRALLVLFFPGCTQPDPFLLTAWLTPVRVSQGTPLTVVDLPRRPDR